MGPTGSATGSAPTHGRVRRSRSRGAALAALAGLSLATLAGCGDETSLQRLGMPYPATEQAPTILQLWQGSWIAAWLVGGLVWGLIIIAVIAFRRRRGDDLPPQTRYNIPIEILYTVAPLIMIMTLFVFTARDQAELTKVSPNPDNTVNVVGFRWSWTFNYVDQNVYEVGTPGQAPTLYLPVNKSVVFELTSPDVIHSFWVPAFLMKMDVVPGRENKFEVTPNLEGTFAGKCAELCGVDHSRMLFNVKVVSQAEFDRHIQELKAKGQVGQLESGRTNLAGDTE